MTRYLLDKRKKKINFPTALALTSQNTKTSSGNNKIKLCSIDKSRWHCIGNNSESENAPRTLKRLIQSAVRSSGKAAGTRKSTLRKSTPVVVTTRAKNSIQWKNSQNFSGERQGLDLPVVNTGNSIQIKCQVISLNILVADGLT